MDPKMNTIQQCDVAAKKVIALIDLQLPSCKELYFCLTPHWSDHTWEYCVQF